MTKMIKAVILFSGGLDSCLAVKLLQKNIKLYGIHFTSPFFTNKNIKKLAKQLKLPLKEIKLKQDYINLIKKPKYGYGKNLNPCIDCKIFMLKQAKIYMNKIKAKFIVTGEVLNERPFSQNYRALQLIEKQAGLKNKILRPLSAKLLPKITAQKHVKNLLDIQGRQRKTQLKLAKKYKLKNYQTPAGGCLLTEIQYSKKLRDLFQHKKKPTPEDCELLKLGRHFNYKNSRIIVGRNEQENKQISKFKSKGILLEPKDIPGPTTLLIGKNIKLAAQLTASHTKTKTKIKYNNKTITVKPLTKKQIEKYRI